MSNKPELLCSFQFDYDGSTTTVMVNTKTGPVFLGDTIGFERPLTPLFNATASGVVGSVTISDNVNPPLTTTATMGAGGVMTVTIPSGLNTGTVWCQVLISY